MEKKGDKICGISISDRALDHFKPFLMNDAIKLQQLKVKSRGETRSKAVRDLIEKNSTTLKNLVLKNIKFAKGLKITCPLPQLEVFKFQDCTGDEFYNSVVGKAPESCILSKHEENEDQDESEDDSEGDFQDESEDDYED